MIKEIKTNSKNAINGLLNLILLGVEHEIDNLDVEARKIDTRRHTVSGNHITNITYSENTLESVKEIKFGTVKFGSEKFGLSEIPHIDTFILGILATLTISFFLENDIIHAEVHTNASIDDHLLVRISEEELHEKNIDIKSLFEDFAK